MKFPCRGGDLTPHRTNHALFGADVHRRANATARLPPARRISTPGVRAISKILSLREPGGAEAAAHHLAATAMTNYRRNFVPGGCQFFTVNLAERKSRLLTGHIDALRTAFRYPRRDIHSRMPGLRPTANHSNIAVLVECRRQHEFEGAKSCKRGSSYLFWLPAPSRWERTPLRRRTESAALTGQVTSDAEGTMEGVVVSARKAGSTVTVSVMSDAQGRYSFPADRLPSGKYTIAIRAAGYDLAGPATADVADEHTATVDLKLAKTKNLAAQMSNAEWIASIPGTEDQKAVPARLRELPHARAHRALDPRFERIHPGHHPHARLRGGEPADQAAAHARSGALRHSRAVSQVGRLPRHHQSERGRSLAISAQDARAPDRPRDAGDHHRIRAAARDDRAA